MAPATTRRLLVLTVLFQIGYLQAGLGPVLPALRDELDVSYGTVGLHLTAFAAGGLLAGLLERRLEDLMGRRTTLWSGALGMAGGAVALAAAPVLALTLAAAALMGLTGTWSVIAVWATVSDEHGDARASAMSEGEAAVSLGSLAVSLAVATTLAGGLGWRPALLAGAVWALGAAIVFRHIRLTPAVAVPTTADHATTAPTGLLPTLVAVFCLGGVEWSLGFWGATFLRDEAQLSESAAAAGLSGFFAAMLIGRLLTSRLTRRVPAARVLTGALSLTAAGVALFVTAPSPAVTTAGLVLSGLGIAATFPLTLALALTAAPDHASLVSARTMAAASLSVLLAPFALGQLADLVGLRIAVTVIPALFAGGATTLAVARRTLPDQRHPDRREALTAAP